MSFINTFQAFGRAGVPLWIAITAAAYVIIRAACCSVTYDEAWTILSFVPGSIGGIMTCEPCDANNHIPNTLLIKALYALLQGPFAPGSLFVARIPALAGMCFYLFHVVRISRMLHRWPAILLAAFACLNPFVLDFFGLARGYALALGFTAAALYWMLRAADAMTVRTSSFALLYAALAAFSSFSFLHLFAAVGLVLFISWLVRDRKPLTLLSWIIIAAALTAVVWIPLHQLILQGRLYYGGETGFYEDTLLSLAKYSCYSMFALPIHRVVLAVFTGVLAVAVIASLFTRPRNAMRNAAAGLVLACVFSVIAQHVLLGTLYVIDRSALFFVPAIAAALAFSVKALPQKLSRVAAMILTVPFVFNFFIHVNFHKTATWFFDAHTESVLGHLEKEAAASSRVLAISYSWPLESSMGYYFTTGRYPHLRVTKKWRNDQDVDFDYFVHLSSPVDKVDYDPGSDPITRIQRDTVMRFESESLFVLKKIE